MSVNNIEMLSSANKAYIENHGTKPAQETETEEKDEEVVEEKNSKLAKVFLGLAALGVAAVAIYKGKQVLSTGEVEKIQHNVPKLTDVYFENAVAKYKKSGDKFTGSIDVLDSGNKYTIEYLDGILQKSTRHGEDAIVKTYFYSKDGKISKIEINGNNINILGEKNRLKSKLTEIENLKEQIREKNDELVPLLTKSQKTDKELLSLYEKEAELNELKLQLDDTQFENRRLPSEEREALKAQVKKSRLKKQKQLEEIKNNSEAAPIQKQEAPSIKIEQTSKEDARKLQKDALKNIKERANADKSDVVQKEQAHTKASKIKQETPELLDTKGENKAIKSHHDVNGFNSDIRYDLKTKGESRRAKRIDEEFKALEPTERDVTVYRGRVKNDLIQRFNEDFDIIENAKVGDVIVPDRGYSYTAMQESLAQHWAGAIKPEDGMMQEIRLPKGAKVSRNLEHGGEVLMPRGAQYMLLSKEKDELGVLKVTMEYILPKA